jgi:hypothetical protein
MGKTTARKGEDAARPGAAETTSGYFRRVLKKDPKLLRKDANAELFERWLKDHPGEKEVPSNVKAILHNLKSVLRKKRRQRRAGKAQEVLIAVEAAPASVAGTAAKGLGQLEERIDECLAVARSMDREGLAQVIELLRRARNQVIRKAGG